jgi:hypothetical protein
VSGVTFLIPKTMGWRDQVACSIESDDGALEDLFAELQEAERACGSEIQNIMACPKPLRPLPFCFSPPLRAPNPLVLDSKFQRGSPGNAPSPQEVDVFEFSPRQGLSVRG